MTHNAKRYQFLRDRFALESSNDEADFAALAHLNGDEFDAALDAAMALAGFEIAQEVDPVEDADIPEAIQLLSDVFEAWENGTPCNEEDGGYLGMAFRLDDDVFSRCCELLNRRNPPRNTAPQAVNAAMREACKAIVAWDDAENDATVYAEDGGAHWRMRQALCADAFDKARAAIAKAVKP